MRGKKLVPALILGLAIILVISMCPSSQAADEATGSWQVRALNTPVQGRVPSFVSADGGIIAWTGANSTDSRTYAYNLATGKNTEISSGLSGSYYNPSIDGQSVVFQGGRTGAYDDIYLYELNNGVRTQLTFNTSPGDANDWNPRIQGGRVVWQKDMVGSSAQPGIYLYDVGMGTTTKIIAGKEFRDPDIWGDYVVCVKGVVAGGKVSSQITLFNLATNETTTLTDASRDNEDPRIDNGKIVWSQGDAWTQGSPNTGLTYQIVVYDIAAGTTTALTNNVAGNAKPAIGGDLVAWETNQPSSIVVRDLTTDANVTLPQQGDTVGSADIDGTTVVFRGNNGLYTAVSPENATTFPDVPKTHPNFAAIEGMAAKDIISGYTTGYFGPNDLVIRQQFAKMIDLTMGLTVTLNDEFNFTDSASILHVEGQLYAYHYVAKAALSGLIEGYPDGSFRPLNHITRQQIITIVVRAGSQVLQPAPADYKGVLSYSDPTHGQNIRLAEYNHLLDGIVGPGGTLAGWNTAGNGTRAECAQILWNLYNMLNPVAPAAS
ncbi:MAG: S-layer homology domain-containing protein [Actinobacteria bacterium]|nr:S-layer homology domain-containing protein [Actinomycetota bacterium]